jgi:hypothetical protein
MQWTSTLPLQKNETAGNRRRTQRRKKSTIM